MRRVIALGCFAALLIGIGIWGFRLWSYRSELDRARREMGRSAFTEAASRLAKLSKQWPGQGEPDYLLGMCFTSEGQIDQALEAWGRVPENAPQAADATLGRTRLAIWNGRFAIAEAGFDRMMRLDPRLGTDVQTLRFRLFWLTGRPDEARKVLEGLCTRSGDPVELLKQLWLTSSSADPIDGVRELLEKANREAPEDDRVWLGLSDLDVRTGRLDEANGWLARCERARPGDPSVWRARLRWALAADRFDELARAATHLTVNQTSAADSLTIQARVAARAGKIEAERAALLALIALEPANTHALERLIDLESSSGDRKRAEALRIRKSEIDKAKERYRKLLTELGADPASKYAELARAAEASGLRFESRSWWTLHARDHRDDPEAIAALERIVIPSSKSIDGTKNLAEFLGLSDFPTGRSTDGPAILAPSFVERAKEAGLSFTFESGRTPLCQLPETMSGGVALLDYDGDGWLDVFCLQGGTFPPVASTRSADRLFRNRHDGTFQDVTERAGLSKMSGGYGHGVSVGDFDNDGHPDLFITRWRSYALYRNRGDGTFADVTEASGLGGSRDWPTSAAWADVDGDGDLDLYVCHYLQWSVGLPPCRPPGATANQYCDPRDFAALPDHLFRNDAGKFVDISVEAGITEADREGRGLGVVATDLDGDGKIDLFVANDTTANDLFRNLGGMKFREEGATSGLAANADGGYHAGMGIGCGDLDGDGKIDLAVTNFYGESTTFYHNLGFGQFIDRSAAIGLARPTRAMLGFGIAFLDANNDGRLDVTIANGHVSDFRPATSYEMPAQLLLGGSAGLTDVIGPPWQTPRIGRGLAIGDLDNDGRIDVVIVSLDSPLVLFQNKTKSDNHFVTLQLDGTRSGRDAIGAKVTLIANGKTQTVQRFGGGSYLSSSDPRLHFGLGTAREVDRIEVVWPSGRIDRFEAVEADGGYRLTEGDGKPSRLMGFEKAG